MKPPAQRSHDDGVATIDVEDANIASFAKPEIRPAVQKHGIF
jgi:hypothetical protein